MAERIEIIGPGEVGVIRRPPPTVVERFVEREIAPPDSVQLDTGEYVSKPEFEKLTPAHQVYLKTHGVDAFNIEQEGLVSVAEEAYEEAVSFVERERFQQEEWERGNLVELDTGEYVHRATFGRLSPEDQTLLKRVGIEQFNIEVSKPALFGRELIEQLIEEGSLRPDAIYTGYDPVTGETKYEVPAEAMVPKTMQEAWDLIVKQDPKLADYTPTSWDPTTGKVWYEVPGEPVEVPAKFIGYLSESKEVLIKYSLPGEAVKTEWRPESEYPEFAALTL